MEKKFLFVGEYEDSYTGGGVVFISTKEFLKEFELQGLKVVLDRFNNELRKIRQFPQSETNDGNYGGITPEHFWELVDSGDFSSDFRQYLKKILNDDEKYPGYGSGNIRVDWFPAKEEGIYIVYEKEVNDESEDIIIISDTYYCA
jgi:hypothetical protein